MADRSVIETFRENHKDPVNLALHAVGFWLMLRGVGRLLRGRLFAAVTLFSAGTAFLVGGHRLEGTDPFAVIRELRAGSAA